MATAQDVRTVSVTAGAAIRLYRFVQLQTSGKFIEVGVAQARADGVCAQAAAGDLSNFAMALPSGIMKVELGATVTAGQLVASDNQGRAIVSVDADGNFLLGVCHVGGASGEIGEVLLWGPAERG